MSLQVPSEGRMNVVWVALRNGGGDDLVYHAQADCQRRGRSPRYPRIPTIESAALAAGAVSCACVHPIGAKAA